MSLAEELYILGVRTHVACSWEHRMAQRNGEWLARNLPLKYDDKRALVEDLNSSMMLGVVEVDVTRGTGRR